MLTDDQRRSLVAAARASVSNRIGGATLSPPSPADLPSASGVFVTLKCSGRLRGCLGVIDMAAPLGAEVVRCAADAATRDPRFPPLTTEELVDLSVEVSVLGPLEPINPSAPEAIVLGRHGLVIEMGDRRGLLLPQVAIEWQWSREQFLRQTCLKAKLAPDAWQHGATVYRFDAEVFGD
jgi:AmmeMemoRadiSam system protein A